LGQAVTVAYVRSHVVHYLQNTTAPHRAGVELHELAADRWEGLKGDGEVDVGMCRRGCLDIGEALLSLPDGYLMGVLFKELLNDTVSCNFFLRQLA